MIIKADTAADDSLGATCFLNRLPPRYSNLKFWVSDFRIGLKARHAIARAEGPGNNSREISSPVRAAQFATSSILIAFVPQCSRSLQRPQIRNQRLHVIRRKLFPECRHLAFHAVTNAP